MIFLKSFSSLFRTGPLHQRRVLSYHTAFLVSTAFLRVFLIWGLTGAVSHDDWHCLRIFDDRFPVFRFPYTVCLTTYEKDFSLRSK